MKNLQLFINENVGRMTCYLDKNSVVQVHLGDSIRGLGFMTVDKTGEEKIMWTQVRSLLKLFGYKTKVTFDSYIPENIFYRLAMRADNTVAEKFQAWIADEVIPALRKTGSYSVKKIADSAERQLQIKARKSATGVYEMYVVYAKRQGDTRKAGRIYAKFSKLANRIAGIADGCRALSTKKELKILAMAEKIISETLMRGIALNWYYKDIEEEVMSKGAEIVQLVSSDVPLLGEGNE